jgi:fatty acid-binding protein DegV
VSQGRIEPLEKVRTSARALSKLVDLSVARAGDRQVWLGVHHLAAPERADAMRASLEARLPSSAPAAVRELGPVMGAHVGPGVIAVAVAAR